MASAHSADHIALRYPSAALQLGPQFYYLWTDEECLTAERALTNPHAVLWEGLLAGDKLKQDTQAAIIRKCREPVIVWQSARGPELRHHIHLYLNEQILAGFALTRYNCRQTHDLHGDEIDYWGEDDSTDENENMLKFSPELCAYYNGESKRLFEEVANPAMRSDGGVTWTHVWWMLEWATAVVLGATKPSQNAEQPK
jgi:hypothetical protein